MLSSLGCAGGENRSRSAVVAARAHLVVRASTRLRGHTGRSDMSATISPAEPKDETFEPVVPPKYPFSKARAAAIAPQTLKLADGRNLEYRVDGDATKPAVVFVHGQHSTSASVIMGGPRDDVFLVMPTRSGYGGSTPNKALTYASIADDVRQLLDHLKIERAHVIGASSGGPCALAIKAELSGRVGKCVIISGDTESGMSQGDLMCCAPGKACGCCFAPCCYPMCLVPMMKQMPPEDKMWETIMNGTEAQAKELGITAVEQAAWTAMDKHGGREQGTFVTGIFKEVMDRGSVGGLQDYILEAKKWPADFVAKLGELDDVTFYHGDKDPVVPFDAMLHNAKYIPKATCHKYVGWGHELGVFMAHGILDEFAAGPPP